MDESILFERIHDALDIEPPSGAYERLRIALLRTPAKPQWPAFQMRGSRMGLRVAAGMTALVIALAAVGAFLAIHRFAQPTTPARPDPAIKAYQTLVLNDDSTMAASTSNHCATVQDTGCPAAVAQVVTTLRQWLDDLNRFRTPARFATVDLQMRRNLSAAISDLNAVVTANQAGNQSGEDRALQAASNERVWVDTVSAGIGRSYQATAATYTELIRSEKSGLDGCADCQQLANSSLLDCNAGSSCPLALTNAANQLASFQSAVIRTAAPASFAAKDRRLQSDLARADTALISMSEAMLAGDQAGFSAGRISFQQALAAVDRDATDISNS